MELDDQLAALAAGELDDDTARALRARAASDAALARRLARHERLQELLTTWTAPPLSQDAATRIDAALDEALAALDDTPLAARAEPTGPLRALTADTRDEPAAAASPRDGVVDMQAARARREQRRGLPAWVPGATVAAALLAVVGTGVVAGLGGGLGSFDEATDDTLADSVTTESAEDEAADSGLAESDAARDDAEESMDEEAALAPAEPDDIQLAEGELLALLDRIEQSDATATQGDGDDTAEADDTDAGAAEPDACVVEALERDTTAADGREVTYLARGTYADQPARFVVISTPTDGGERIEVLAYDPADCSLLARDEVLASAGG